MAQVVGSDTRKWSVAEFDDLFDSVKNWGRWGADDAKGTLNYITPEHVRHAASLVRSGRSISLSLPVNKVAGPDNPNPAIHYMATGHDNDIGSGSLRFATDFLGMQFHGDCHTHIDALCHIAYRGQLYNGRPAGLVTTSGADVFDITEYAPRRSRPRRAARHTSPPRRRLAGARNGGDPRRARGCRGGTRGASR